MNKRILKVILVWNAALTALLLASLLVNANFAMAANDPPVQMFSANSDHAGGLDGGGTITNYNIYSDTTWSQLVVVNVDFGAQTHNHHCAVIASADVINPYSGSSHNSYRFDVSVDNPTSGADTISGRTLDFINSVSGSAAMPVTTNRVFTNISNGQHSFYFLARKATGAPNTTVADSSMSVICMKTLQ